MSETWRPDKSDIWKTPKTQIHGCRKYDNKHRVRILLNRNRIHPRTGHHYHNRGWPRVFTAPTRDMQTTTLKKCTEQSRSTRQTAKNAYWLLEETSMLIWDQDAELNVQVLANTQSKEETREVTRWNIGWGYTTLTALNTMYRKNPGKHTTCRSPKRNE